MTTKTIEEAGALGMFKDPPWVDFGEAAYAKGETIFRNARQGSKLAALIAGKVSTALASEAEMIELACLRIADVIGLSAFRARVVRELHPGDDSSSGFDDTVLTIDGVPVWRAQWVRETSSLTVLHIRWLADPERFA